MIVKEYTEVMQSEQIDFIISPNGFGELPPKIDDILNPAQDEDKSPVFEYKMDYFTTPANCLGVPAITIPLFEDGAQSKTAYKGFPGSIRLQGYYGEDFHMLRSAQKIQRILEDNGMGIH